MRARFVCSAVTTLVLASSLMTSASAQSLTAEERLEAIRQLFKHLGDTVVKETK